MSMAAMNTDEVAIVSGEMMPWRWSTPHRRPRSAPALQMAANDGKTHRHRTGAHRGPMLLARHWP